MLALRLDQKATELGVSQAREKKARVEAEAESARVKQANYVLNLHAASMELQKGNIEEAKCVMAAMRGPDHGGEGIVDPDSIELDEGAYE